MEQEKEVTFFDVFKPPGTALNMLFRSIPFLSLLMFYMNGWIKEPENSNLLDPKRRMWGVSSLTLIYFHLTLNNFSWRNFRALYFLVSRILYACADTGLMLTVDSAMCSRVIANGLTFNAFIPSGINLFSHMGLFFIILPVSCRSYTLYKSLRQMMGYHYEETYKDPSELPIQEDWFFAGTYVLSLFVVPLTALFATQMAFVGICKGNIKDNMGFYYFYSFTLISGSTLLVISELYFAHIHNMSIPKMFILDNFFDTKPYQSLFNYVYMIGQFLITISFTDFYYWYREPITIKVTKASPRPSPVKPKKKKRTKTQKQPVPQMDPNRLAPPVFRDDFKEEPKTVYKKPKKESPDSRYNKELTAAEKKRLEKEKMEQEIQRRREMARVETERVLEREREMENLREAQQPQGRKKGHQHGHQHGHHYHRYN